MISYYDVSGKPYSRPLKYATCVFGKIPTFGNMSPVVFGNMPIFLSKNRTAPPSRLCSTALSEAACMCLRHCLYETHSYKQQLDDCPEPDTLAVTTYVVGFCV